MTITHPPPGGARWMRDDDASDATLIEKSRDEPEWFAVIFDRYFAQIHRYAASRLGHAAADDVAADTFLAAFNHRNRYDLSRPTAKAWLYGIATHPISKHCRKEGRMYRAMERAAVHDSADSHADRVAERVSAEGLAPQLTAGLAALSAGDRDVLLLVAYGQLGYDEVAVALGIPSGTVGSRLNRARQTRRRRTRTGDDPWMRWNCSGRITTPSGRPRPKSSRRPGAG